VAAARAAGTIVVASAGNDSSNVANYSPASEPGVVTVSAVDATKGLAWYSNFGAGIDVAAPGGDESVDTTGDGITDGVISLVYANRGTRLYAPYEGTSMASPHVAAIVALMRAAYPALTPDDVDQMIAGTRGVGPIVTDLGAAGKDNQFGHGLLNANLAVLSALEAANASAPDVPVLLLSAPTLDFGATVDELPLEISNAGRGTLTVTNVTTSAGWITVLPRALGVNTVTVDRSGLTDGVHVGTITVETNGGTGTVDVRATVTSTPAVTGGNVGAVFVLAVDPKTNVVVAQARAVSADGYAFRMTGLPTGDYRLLAGTDLDESGIIDDEGEAFGAYPVTSDPGIIPLNSDRANLDFPVRFQFGVSGQSMRRGVAKAPY
jgi:serine protease